MKNVTEEYANMLSAFYCDFAVAQEHQKFLKTDYFPMSIPVNKKLIKDIELLHELETKIRYGQIKIMDMGEKSNV